MAIDFPNSPSVGQLYEFNDKTWRWSGDYWEVFSAQTGYISGAISSGSGESVYSGQSGSTIVLRSISGGTNTTVSTVGDLLKIDVSAGGDLATILAGGNTTGGNDIIITNGDNIRAINSDPAKTVNIDFGASVSNRYFDVTTDDGNYNTPFLSLTPTLVQLGSNDALLEISDNTNNIDVKAGTFRIKNGPYFSSFIIDTLTANRTYTFPNNTGTVALLSDITPFTGNTSGSCITDLYITNLYGCSPITIHDNLVPDLNNDKDLGAPSFRWREIYTTNIDVANAATIEYLFVDAFSEFYDDVNITGNTIIDGGLTATTGLFSSSTDNVLTVIGSGGTNTEPLFNVIGSDGNLLTITDSLFGSIFLVNDVSGLPILEVDATTGATDYFYVNADSEFNGDVSITGNTAINGGLTATTGLFSSSTDNVLRVVGSGGTDTEPLFAIEGSSGELFSVTDSLEGSLFSVNDVSGLPIFDVNSDNTILMGNISALSLNTTKKEVISAGSTNLYSIPVSAYTGGFFDYTAVGNGGARSGNIISIWSGTTTQFNEITTNDIGSSTSGLSFNVFVSGGSAILSASAVTGTYTIKTIIRGI